MEPVARSSSLLPPKPEEPLDSECCGTGCTPCVFDIYKDKVKRWEVECIRISDGEGVLFNGDEKCSNPIISPYEYGKFLVTDITEDCLNCKIIQFQRHRQDEDHSVSAHVTFVGSHFPVKLGQHVVLKLEETFRQYTVLDVRKDGSFRIVFKIYEHGQLTPLVDKLVPETIVEMRGPFGSEFKYKPNQYACLLMFAAGTGIAPFCRIIQTVLNNDLDETRIILCYACQDENQVILLEKLKEWSGSWNFQVQYFLSSVKVEAKAKSIHYGMKVNLDRIDKTVIKELCKPYVNKNNISYMICGTKSFEKDIVNHLKYVGVNEEVIKTF